MTEENAHEASLLDRLGARIASLRYEEITPYGLQLVQMAVIDTLGVSIAGAASDPARLTRQMVLAQGGVGDSLILGSSRRSNALDAGMVNGVAAHALDFDDGNSIMGGHPSTMLVPAIFALGEELDASAKDIILAYTAGYEVIIRLSRGLNSYHYEKGWHPTATIGVFGVAAAGAKLLGLNSAQTAIALAIAASMPSGLKANFGTMVKSFHVGHAIRDGLTCAKLAQEGFTANTSALEHKQGFLELYNGAGNYSIQKIIDDLGVELEVNREYNPVKLFPCCASTHSPIESAIEIRRKHHPRPEDVEHIQIVVDKNRMPHTDRLDLPEALSGKFSVQYVVARGLIDGAVSLSHFEGDAHRDRTVLDLMSKTEVKAAPTGGKPNSFDATVTVTLANGQRLEAETFRRTKADVDGELLADPNLWSKFASCAGRQLDPGRVRDIENTLKDFEDLPKVRGLMALLEARSAQTPLRQPLQASAS